MCKLAIEHPLDEPGSRKIQILDYLDIATTIIFSVEAALKIISYGFVANGMKSYLRNLWNTMDFGIVIVSIVSLSVRSQSLKSLKVFRLLKVLRPLRMIARNEGLKIALQALIMAVPNIASVTVISLLFFLIFGIIGVNYFKGKFYYCFTGAINS